ncbi:GNAT family N-acetyltransferase [Chitinophaga vietnamensis]|uniref:GNAT family N-acetyltransferase n=1 Tax=Chitinophaga vietnamensis TaxID=2593957 RepID=UPI0011779D3F|nr:GNAT family N-acetyltransferase [Chitinophaga vietnamensis]
MIFTNDYRDLQNLPTENIAQAFNAAFSDYIVPLQLTPALLENKMKGENLKREFSMGAFNGDELCAFVLHGIDNDQQPRVLYNGGTGVVPAFRGQHLVQKMYDKFIPLYQQQGIHTIYLEVISTNLPAIKAYTNSGFTKTRKLICHKGEIQLKKTAPAVAIQLQETPNWALLATFMDMQPTWSNIPATIQREHPSTATWTATVDGQTAGYISIHQPTRRIRNIAVSPAFRRRGIGSALLQQAASLLGGPFTLINIDAGHPGISAFLEQAGMPQYLTQYEMAINI